MFQLFLLSLCFVLLQILVFSLPLQNISSQFCHHDEKMALLQFKNSLVITDYDVHCTGKQKLYPKTESWKAKTDFCFWDGVTCDFVRGHVIGLDLSCSLLSGSIHPNSSLFHLRHLQTLNLAYNLFDGSQIPPKIGLFSGLKVLNLSGSGFVGQVPIEIARLSRLVLLDLSSPTPMEDITSTQSASFSDPFDWSMLLLIDIFVKLDEMAHFDTIVRNLTNLRQLHLNHVMINSVLPKTVANLSSVTSLELNFCYLQGVFPSNILKLPQLHSLSINWNPNLYFDAAKFNNLSSSLEVLDLSNTTLSGRLPEYSLGSNPPKLRKFLAYLCELTGTIPSWVWNTTEEIQLSGNLLIGELPSAINTKELSRFNNLGLSNNFLKGAIPSWLWDLPSLVSLDLSSNNFTGELDGSSFPGNSSLEFLQLGMNNLRVQIDTFSELKHLISLDLSNNAVSLYGGANSLISWPKLSVLKLSSCSLSSFLDFLRYQQDLKILDLSNNRIQGEVPSWLKDVGKNTLTILNISHNHLTGGIELLSWKNLMYIDIRFNSLQGFLPVPPAYASMFFASNNKFQGKISSSFCNMPRLVILDLAYNQLSGNIPRCLGYFPSIPDPGALTNISQVFQTLGNRGSFSLMILNLRSNKLHGKVLLNFTVFCNLQSIDLNDNQFEGKVPRTLRRCKSLQVLDFGKNRFKDTFPHWLGTLPQLKVLALNLNYFQGPIKNSPKANKNPFSKLQILNLSGNQFTGKLPVRYISKFKAMMVNNDSGHNSSIHYIGNFLYYHDSIVLTIKGSTLYFDKILTILTTLDISNNIFTGDIPSSMGQLATLIGLNMSYNCLTGHIPPSLANLSSLEFLDLSCNRLEGEIPPQLLRLTFLEVLNVSENRLVGRIPEGNQFNTFPSSSYKDNLGLCGVPLPECERKGSLDHPQHEKNNFVDNILSISLWNIILMGFGFGTILGCVAGGGMLFTVKLVWFSRKVDKIEYIMVQSFTKHSRRRQN